MYITYFYFLKRIYVHSHSLKKRKKKERGNTSTCHKKLGRKIFLNSNHRYIFILKTELHLFVYNLYFLPMKLIHIKCLKFINKNLKNQWPQLITLNKFVH